MQKNDDPGYEQRYTKYLTQTCQEIFAPYSNDKNFPYLDEFQTYKNSNSLE